MYLLYESIELFACIATYANCIILVAGIFPKSKHFRKWLLVLAAIPCTLLVWHPVAGISIDLLSFLSIALEIAICLFLFHGTPWGISFTVILFYLAELLLSNLLSSGLLFFCDVPASSLIVPCSAIRTSYLLLLYLLETTIIYLIRRFCSSKIQGLRWNRHEFFIGGLYFLTDFLVTFLIYYLIAYHMPKDDFIIILCLLFNIALLLLSAIGLFILGQLHNANAMITENKLLQLQLENQKQMMKEHEKKYSQIRELRHNLKQYLINYRFLLKEGNVSAVLSSISEILDGPLESIDYVYTENQMLNALLVSKTASCRDYDIATQIRVKINPLYQDIDLMVVLGNLWENAIEAEQKEPSASRIIRFEVIEEGHKLSIVIQNYISESVLDTNLELRSTKTSPVEHGWGIKSIRNYIHGRNGLLDIYEEENMFCVHLLIPLVYK